MPWLAIIVAGAFEIVLAFGMKQSHGFTRLWPSVIAISAMVISLGLLSWSMRSLPLGTAYAVWTGIGAVGTFVVGIVVLGEAVTPLRVTAALFILLGLVMMKMATGSPA